MIDSTRRIIRLDSTGSTNTYLRGLALGGAEEGTVVTARHQTAGRGRMGRSFHSPAGSGIYMSYLLRPGDSADISSVTGWTAVAVMLAIEECCGVKTGIKWVNDLVYGGKKVCGILTEAVFDGGRVSHVICGVGINVNADSFPEELREKAVSLSMIKGHPMDFEALLSAVIRRLDALSADWPREKDKYLSLYRENCVTLGRDVTFTRGGAELKGRAVGIEDDFSLTVRLENGETVTVSSGEVSVRGIYGYV